jgi:hypothetical protein
MTSPGTDHYEPIDGKTSRSIRDAVGERLQQYLKPHSLAPSPQLDLLVEALDRRERESAGGDRPQGGTVFFR